MNYILKMDKLFFVLVTRLFHVNCVLLFIVFTTVIILPKHSIMQQDKSCNLIILPILTELNIRMQSFKSFPELFVTLW